jgi:hypothetical protein
MKQTAGRKNFDDLTLSAEAADTGFFGGLMNTVTGLISKGSAALQPVREAYAQVAPIYQGLGGTLPLDKDVALLQTAQSEVRKMRARATSLLNTTVHKIILQGDERSTRIGNDLKIRGEKAVSKANTVDQYYAAAISAAQTINSLLASAKPVDIQMVAYNGHKQNATQQGAAVAQDFNNFFSAVDQSWNDLLVPSASALVGGTVQQIGGEIVSGAAAIGKGALTIAPALPWIIGGAVALYVLAMGRSLLPRRR